MMSVRYPNGLMLGIRKDIYMWGFFSLIEQEEVECNVCSFCKSCTTKSIINETTQFRQTGRLLGQTIVLIRE